MAGDTTIRAIIKLLVEGGHIPKEVATQIKGVGGAADETKKKLGALGQTGKELGTMLTQFLGAAALGSFIKSSVTQFADLDRSFNALGFTMRKLGVGGAEDLARARTEMEALALSGGPLQSQTVPALQKFVVMTHDTDKALAAVKLASDVSEAGVTDFGSAAAGVAALLQGKVKVAATQFGIDLTDINGKAKTNADLIREIEKTYGGLGDAFDDAANKIDTLDARWEQLKQTVGKGFAPAIGVITDALFHAIGAAKDLGDFFGLVFNGILAVARGTGRGLAAVFDLKTLISDPGKYLDGLKQTFTANVGDMKDAWSTFTEGLAANHSKAAGKVADTTKGMAELLKQAAKATAEDDAKAAAEAAQKRLEIEHKTTQDMLQAQISAAKEGSVERLALELALLADQEKAAVESATRAGADVNKIHAAFAIQRAAKEKQFAEARAADEREFTARLLQLEIDGAAENSEKRFELESEAINRGYQAEVEAAEKAGHDSTLIRLAWQKELSNKTLAFIAARSAAELEAQGRVIESEREMRDADFEYALVGLEDNTAKSYAIQHAAIEAHFKDVEADLNAQLEANARSAEGTVAIQSELQNKLIENEAKYGAAAKRLELSVSQFKQQAYFSAANTAVNSMEFVLGEHKVFALAHLAIDTASAVMQVWADQAGGPWPVKLAKTVLIGVIAEKQRQIISGASAGGSGSAAGLMNEVANAPVGSSGSASTAAATHASQGMVVPGAAPKMASGGVAHPGQPKGADTVPAWLAPGEIVADAASSKDVLSGKAIIAAGSVKGTPDSPAKSIVGGKLSLIPTKKGGPGALPGPRSSILGDPARPVSARKGATPVVYAREGLVAPGGSEARGGPRRGSIEGLKEVIGRAGVWFKMAFQPVPDDTAPSLPSIASKAGGPQTVQLGGAKGSSALMPALGGAAMGGAVKASMQPASDPGFAKVVDKLDELKPKGDASSKPTEIDNSITIEGNVYGGDAGARELVRVLDRARRLDSNRIIR